MDRQYFKSNISPTVTYQGSVTHTLKLLAEKLGITFGPYGTYNLFKNGADIRASKDGFENLQMIKFNESIPEAVYTMALEIAKDQADVVGDGTTSAILVMAEVYNQLMVSDIWMKYTPSMINSTMREIQTTLEDHLTKMALPLIRFNLLVCDNDMIRALLDTTLNGNTELVNVLMALNDNVPDVMNKNILMDYSTTTETTFSTVPGITIMGKLMSPAFGNLADDVSVLKNTEIIVVDGKVNILNDMLNYVNKLKTLNKSLLIICSGVNENFYRYIELVAQKQPEVLANFCVVYTSANSIMDRDAFQDLVKSIDCVYMAENTEISLVSIENIHKGFAENICVKNGHLTLGGCIKGSAFDDYIVGLELEITTLNDSIANANTSSSEKTVLEVRLSKVKNRYYKLLDGSTTVYSGGDTYQNKHITFKAIEDGIKSLQSGLKYGYFEGCNTVVPNMLIQLMVGQRITDEHVGRSTSIYYDLEQCLLFAYIDVYKRLIRNRAILSEYELMKTILGYEFEYIIDKKNNYITVVPELLGKIVFFPLDLTDNEKHIINPAKTDINIIRKAISGAVVLATSNTIITDRVEFEATV